MYTFFAMCNWCYTKNYFRGLSCRHIYSKSNFTARLGFIGAFFAALGILFEENKRWPEMSMVLFPRLFEAWLRNLAKLKYSVSFKYGPHLFLALAMGIISWIYQQQVRSKVKSFSELLIA